MAHRMERCPHCGKPSQDWSAAEHLSQCARGGQRARPRLQPISEMEQQRIQSSDYWSRTPSQSEGSGSAQGLSTPSETVRTNNSSPFTKKSNQSPQQSPCQEASTNSMKSHSTIGQPGQQSESGSIRAISEIIQQPESRREWHHCSICGYSGLYANWSGDDACDSCRQNPSSPAQPQQSDGDGLSQLDYDSSATVINLLLQFGRVFGQESQQDHSEQPQENSEGLDTAAIFFPQNNQPIQVRENPSETQSDVSVQLASIPALLVYLEQFLQQLRSTVQEFFFILEIGGGGLDANSLSTLQRLRFQQREGINQMCAICQQDFQQDDELLKLRCTHDFHTECLVPWLEVNTTCPLCKRDQSIQQGID